MKAIVEFTPAFKAAEIAVPHSEYPPGLFDKKELTEYKAYYFASYFLLPEDGIINLIPENELYRDEIKLETILKIEHYFSCIIFPAPGQPY